MDLNAVNGALVSITGVIDDFMYTYILVILLIAVGIWFSIRTKFVQIRYIKEMFTSLVSSSDKIKDEEKAEFSSDEKLENASLNNHEKFKAK